MAKADGPVGTVRDFLFCDRTEFALESPPPTTVAAIGGSFAMSLG
jgi:hypothetical protein